MNIAKGKWIRTAAYIALRTTVSRLWPNVSGVLQNFNTKLKRVREMSKKYQFTVIFINEISDDELNEGGEI